MTACESLRLISGTHADNVLKISWLTHRVSKWCMPTCQSESEFSSTCHWDPGKSLCSAAMSGDYALTLWHNFECVTSVLNLMNDMNVW